MESMRSIGLGIHGITVRPLGDGLLRFDIWKVVKGDLVCLKQVKNPLSTDP